MFLDHLHHPAHSADPSPRRQRPRGGDRQSASFTGLVEITPDTRFDLIWSAITQQEGGQVAVDHRIRHYLPDQGCVNFRTVVDIPDPQLVLEIQQMSHGAVRMLVPIGISWGHRGIAVPTTPGSQSQAGGVTVSAMPAAGQ